MPKLLVLCPITDIMRDRVASAFDLIEVGNIDDFDTWLSTHGEAVRFILTDGHLGISQDVLAQLPNAEIISSYGVGYDAVDVTAATERRIPVCHTPGVLNEEVATTALMLYLACWRNLEQQMAQARSGRWATEGSLPLSRTADNRTVGILGLGRIGKAVARKLAPFNTRILYFGRNKQEVEFAYFDDLKAMAQACDAMICIAPGDASTYRLIDRTVMDAIGPDGFLINVGRGSTVDEPALIDALQSGTLGGAGLDVFEDEPRIPDALRALPNTVLLPHVGSATEETRRAMGDLAIDNLIAWKNDQPLLTPVPESQQLL